MLKTEILFLHLSELMTKISQKPNKNGFQFIGVPIVEFSASYFVWEILCVVTVPARSHLNGLIFFAPSPKKITAVTQQYNNNSTTLPKIVRQLLTFYLCGWKEKKM